MIQCPSPARRLFLAVHSDGLRFGSARNWRPQCACPGSRSSSEMLSKAKAMAKARRDDNSLSSGIRDWAVIPASAQCVSGAVRVRPCCAVCVEWSWLWSWSLEFINNLRWSECLLACFERLNNLKRRSEAVLPAGLVLLYAFPRD